VPSHGIFLSITLRTLVTSHNPTPSIAAPAEQSREQATATGPVYSACLHSFNACSRRRLALKVSRNPCKGVPVSLRPLYRVHPVEGNGIPAHLPRASLTECPTCWCSCSDHKEYFVALAPGYRVHAMRWSAIASPSCSSHLQAEALAKASCTSWPRSAEQAYPRRPSAVVASRMTRLSTDDRRVSDVIYWRPIVQLIFAWQSNLNLSAGTRKRFRFFSEKESSFTE